MITYKQIQDVLARIRNEVTFDLNIQERFAYYKEIDLTWKGFMLTFLLAGQIVGKKDFAEAFAVIDQLPDGWNLSPFKVDIGFQKLQERISQARENFPNMTIHESIGMAFLEYVYEIVGK